MTKKEIIAKDESIFGEIWLIQKNRDFVEQYHLDTTFYNSLQMNDQNQILNWRFYSQHQFDSILQICANLKRPYTGLIINMNNKIHNLNYLSKINEVVYLEIHFSDYSLDISPISYMPNLKYIQLYKSDCLEICPLINDLSNLHRIEFYLASELINSDTCLKRINTKCLNDSILCSKFFYNYYPGCIMP